MLTVDLIEISLRQVLRHRRRYRDVILLISLGIAGVIVVQATGDSVLRSISRDLEILGNSCLLRAEVDLRAVDKPLCEYSHNDVEMLRRLKGVRTVSPFVGKENCRVFTNQKRTSVKLLGIEPGFLDAARLRLGRGIGISEADVINRRPVCLMGQLIVQELFDAPSVALGQKILIAGIAFQVIGILGGIEEREFLDAVMIPISIARGQISDSYEIRDMYIRATHWQTVRRLHGEIKSVLQRNHPGYADTIVVRYFPKRIEKIENALSVVHILLLAALSVALVVGVVGIANVMLTAVQERTIEIGLRKVHGATERAIRVQFLGEAVITTLAGALLGIVMGVGAVKALEVALAIDANHTVLFVTTAAVALFGVAAGILSGFVPARRASSLDPGAALRFE